MEQEPDNFPLYCSKEYIVGKRAISVRDVTSFPQFTGLTSTSLHSQTGERLCLGPPIRRQYFLLASVLTDVKMIERSVSQRASLKIKLCNKKLIQGMLPAKIKQFQNVKVHSSRVNHLKRSLTKIWSHCMVTFMDDNPSVSTFYLLNVFPCSLGLCLSPHNMDGGTQEAENKNVKMSNSCSFCAKILHPNMRQELFGRRCCWVFLVPVMSRWGPLSWRGRLESWRRTERVVSRAGGLRALSPH